MSGTTVPLVACDGCGKEVLGASASGVTQLRRTLRGSGWRRGRGLDGLMRDLCPNCARSRAGAPGGEG